MGLKRPTRLGARKKEEAAGEAASSGLASVPMQDLLSVRLGSTLVRPCREGGCFSLYYSVGVGLWFRPTTEFSLRWRA